MANVASIKRWDIANGKGIRVSVFFSGCTFGCKNCFNSEIWDFNAGTPFSIDFYDNEIRPTINEHIGGISILGGEPLHPYNIRGVTDLVLLFKLDFSDKDIWLWTGYTWEELLELIDGEDANYALSLETILYNIDVLVDGQFVESKKDLTLKWRGSSNQRVIDVQKSLGEGKVVLFDQ